MDNIKSNDVYDKKDFVIRSSFDRRSGDGRRILHDLDYFNTRLERRVNMIGRRLKRRRKSAA